MKSLKYFFFVIFFLAFSSVAIADNVFIFSTDPQSIPVGQISGKINVQSQTPVTETTYLSFTSSSPTGQFLNSSGNPLTSAYISNGDSNRAVYYKDSMAGDFVISADVLSKDKTKITTITQHIFVGIQNSSGGSDATTTNDTSSQSNSSDTTTNTSASGGISAHSSPAPLSDTDQKIVFEISAGRDRLTSVGNNIDFKAVQTKPQGALGNGVVYTWSFGDGTTGQGSLVSHSYRFAGDYSVVCDASFSDDQAVSRISVKVIEPKISISYIPGGVEIANNSGAEINLEDWKIAGPKKTFTFPKDTLLPNGKKVIFADEVTGMNSGNITLENPLGKNYAEIVDNSNIQINTSTDQITTEIKKVTEALAVISPKVQELSGQDKIGSSGSKVELISTTPPILEKTSAGATTSNTIKATSSQTANAITIFEASKSKGLIGKIFFWPIAGFNFIRGLFVEK